MKGLIVASVLSLALPSLVWAQQRPTEITPLLPGPGAPTLIACSYNSTGAYTDADSAEPGEKAGRPVKTGGGWRQVLDIPDGRSCPRQIDL
jgi:hypothetical protein